MIWLTQWICSERHCAFAVAWSDTEATPAQIEADGPAARARLGLNDHCGICGGAIRPEHGRTRFATLAEAEPELRWFERRQQATRRMLDALGLSRERAP